MKNTLFAVAVVGAAFFVVSGPSQAIPIAPLSVVAPEHDGAVTRVSWHDHGYAGRHGRWSGRGGGMFARFGNFKSVLGMLGGQGGGGIMSMLGGMGGSGDMGNIASMLGGMGGSGGGGIGSMLGGMGGSGGMGNIASMLGGTGGSGGGFGSMLSGMGGSGFGGSGGSESSSVGHVSQSARQACTPDALRLCSDYIPDVAKITACMKAKQSQLSEPCRAAMNAEGGGQSRLAGRATPVPNRGRDTASYGGDENTSSSGGQGFGNYDAGPGYDHSGNIGQMMGMVKSLGFGSFGRW
jgi:hypothetical protein